MNTVITEVAVSLIFLMPEESGRYNHGYLKGSIG